MKCQFVTQKDVETLRLHLYHSLDLPAKSLCGTVEMRPRETAWTISSTLFFDHITRACMECYERGVAMENGGTP